MDITIYSTTTCGICHALMQWLDKKGVAYKEVVIDTDPNGMAELMEVSEGAIGTPFSVVKSSDGTVTKIQGFDQKKFESLIAA